VELLAHICRDPIAVNFLSQGYAEQTCLWKTFFFRLPQRNAFTPRLVPTVAKSYKAKPSISETRRAMLDQSITKQR